jgi:hypothetical protein
MRLRYTEPAARELDAGIAAMPHKGNAGAAPAHATTFAAVSPHWAGFVTEAPG